METQRRILGIESSCDETAAAVVAGGRCVLSSVVASQGCVHARWGGVVPELASREHLRNIVPVVREALAQAGVGLAQLDALAVTRGPGLAGALTVGVTYARTLAWALGKPLIAVNHLEGHIHAVLLEHAAQAYPLPAVALVASGGHTHLYLATQHGAGWSYRILGHTVDDAAGEAFDKVAKLLGLGYPGGPWIDRLAPFGNAHAVPFRFAQPRERAGRQRAIASLSARLSASLSAGHSGRDAAQPRSLIRFSFSGIKTAVLRYVEQHGMASASARRAAALADLAAPSVDTVRELCDQPTLDLLASFQHAVVGVLVQRTMAAAQQQQTPTVLVTGGVAANRELRARFAAAGKAAGRSVLFPAPALATDNAAMIAAAAWPRLLDGDHALDDLEAQPRLQLGV